MMPQPSQKQLSIDWEIAQQRGKIDRIAAKISSGELRVLRAIHGELIAQRRTADQIPIDLLLAQTGYRRSRFYDYRRLLEAREIILLRQPAGTYRGDGAEYQIDWQRIEFLAGPARETSEDIETGELSDSCPTGVRQVSDFEENTPPAYYTPPKELRSPPPTNSGTAADRAAEEEEWEDLRIELTEIGNLADAGGAIAGARANGCQPHHVRPLIEEFAWKYPGRWSPGELWHRVKTHSPRLDPTKGWGPGNLRAVERYRALAKDLCRAIEAMTDERFAEVSEKSLGVRHGRDSPGIVQRIIDEKIKAMNREALGNNLAPFAPSR